MIQSTDGENRWDLVIATTTDYDCVLIYHDATKHHPHRYAKSLGYLDWATQPSPFRRFHGAPLVPLLTGPFGHEPTYGALFDPDSTSAQPVTRRSISALLECSLGLSAWKAYGTSTWALRCNPSSGNLHPTEGYLLFGPVAGIGEQPALYHYAPKEHVLEKRHEVTPDAWNSLMAPLGQDMFLVGLTSILWREAWKYGERAFRYCQHDIGHALAALRLAAAMLGWQLTIIEHLGDSDIAHLLGLDRADDFSDGESEEPELMAIVSPNGDPRPPGTIECSALGHLADGSWEGKANRLSSDHVQWDIIDMVRDATKKPRTEPEAHTRASAGDSQERPEHSADPTARRVIIQRRSATDFDGRTSIPRATFYAMLTRVLPTQTAPFDAISWPPAIHLLMFVHLVDDLAPGLYVLARNSAKVAELRASMKSDFAWTPASECPSGLPLHLLLPADCRRAAAQLSLGQAIAGDSAFSFAMVAEFENSLQRWGPWFYRRLFWEAGMIGQVLYLEAESAGIRAGNSLRATGIGAYFDEAVHEVFGLSGHRYQSLYHFTLGGAVDDPRLTTRPPYDEKINDRS